jgi:hypothetical protein
LRIVSRRNVESMMNRLSAIAQPPFTKVSEADALHALEEIDLPNPFASAFRIVTEVTVSLDKTCRLPVFISSSDC